MTALRIVILGVLVGCKVVTPDLVNHVAEKCKGNGGWKQISVIDDMYWCSGGLRGDLPDDKALKHEGE